MRKVFSAHWFFILTLLMLSIFYISGVSKVPFHPDESTLIYMSADFENLFSDPLSMSWKAGDPIPDTVRYRMIDAPITRYLLGFGRSINKKTAPQVDWDWSATWEENAIAGALPDERLLLTERLVVASLFPLTILLLYLIGLKFDGRFLGILIVLLFSLNPLILLHTRRAMAEGVLVFGLVLTLYFMLNLEKYPFLVGLTAALAFNAKHSAFVLIPIGFFAVCWPIFSNSRSFSRLASNTFQYLSGLFLLTLLLNPFLWHNPATAAFKALEQREALLAKQQADFTEWFPGQVLESPVERATVMLAQIIIAPPIFAEVGNYLEDTRKTEIEYLQTPGNVVGRNLISGGLLLGSMFLGSLILIRRILICGPGKHRNSTILLLSMAVLMVGYILLIPLAWQRYSVPLIPFTSIIAGIGLVWGIKNSRRIFFHGSLSSRLSQILTQFSTNSRMP